MLQSLRFLGGVWIGASLLGCGVAKSLLYLWTGKVPLPSATGLRLVELDEAVAWLRTVANQLLEGRRG